MIATVQYLSFWFGTKVAEVQILHSFSHLFNTGRRRTLVNDSGVPLVGRGIRWCGIKINLPPGVAGFQPHAATPRLLLDGDRRAVRREVFVYLKRECLTECEDLPRRRAQKTLVRAASDIWLVRS